VNSVLTDPALTDLDSLRSFIARDSSAAAKREAARIFDAIERLAEQPNMGRPGRVAATRELVVAPYLIIYTVDAGRLVVLRIIHGARRWP
jgi:plasmid stabilization system protein ParE